MVRYWLKYRLNKIKCWINILSIAILRLCYAVAVVLLMPIHAADGSWPLVSGDGMSAAVPVW